MKKFIALGLLALGTFAFANTNESTETTTIEEDAAFCALQRCVTFTYYDGSGSGTFCYCVPLLEEH